jgi:hypothetical protein
MHVTATSYAPDPLAGTILTITGHHTGSGTPLTAEQSAYAYVSEVYPEGSFVDYQGSIAACHGTYRVTGPCTDELCTEDFEDHYVLTDDGTGLQLDHVRASSLAAHTTYCLHCATTTQVA